LERNPQKKKKAPYVKATLEDSKKARNRFGRERKTEKDNGACTIAVDLNVSKQKKRGKKIDIPGGGPIHNTGRADALQEHGQPSGSLRERKEKRGPCFMSQLRLHATSGDEQEMKGLRGSAKMDDNRKKRDSTTRKPQKRFYGRKRSLDITLARERPPRPA